MQSAGTPGHTRGYRDRRTDDSDRASPIGAAWFGSLVPEPRPQQPTAAARRCSLAASEHSIFRTANSLLSFALWPAFPTSDYYESSVPLPSRQTTAVLPFVGSSKPSERRLGNGSHVHHTPIDGGAGPSSSPAALRWVRRRHFPSASGSSELADFLRVGALGIRGRRIRLASPYP